MTEAVSSKKQVSAVEAFKVLVEEIDATGVFLDRPADAVKFIAQCVSSALTKLIHQEAAVCDPHGSLIERLRNHGDSLCDEAALEIELLQDREARLRGSHETVAEPLSKRVYVMSEPHLSGARVVVGFSTLEDASEAHAWISRRAQKTEAKCPDTGGYECPRGDDCKC